MDRYLKEIENGWETTPRVRGCMLTYTGLAVTDFPEEDFPVPRTVYRPFHLDASAGKLLDTAPTKKGEITYPSDEFAGKACFTFTADRRIDIFGMIKVKFWTSYDTGADADYHCIIRKLDTRGKTLRHNKHPLQRFAPQRTVRLRSP